MQPMYSIHIFNPETDYALALGRRLYSPPARIVEFRKKMSLFPASFANPGDAILVLDYMDISDSGLLFRDEAKAKSIEILTVEDIGTFIRNHGDKFTLRPWGWNHTLRNKLLNSGIPQQMLKTDEEIETLRQLSHRRTTIRFNHYLAETLDDVDIPMEFDSIDEAMRFASRHALTYFKMPWSSSGRGVVSTARLSGDSLRNWIAGSIRRQGSVLAEIGHLRKGDFATEWECDNGEAIFLGLSLFQTSQDGRYSGNEIISQREISQNISEMSPYWSDEIISAQRKALESIITPYYSGPAGIDMFATADGKINPCVEINLRQTMGMAALWKSRQLSDSPS